MSLSVFKKRLCSVFRLSIEVSRIYLFQNFIAKILECPKSPVRRSQKATFSFDLTANRLVRFFFIKLCQKFINRAFHQTFMRQNYLKKKFWQKFILLSAILASVLIILFLLNFILSKSLAS